MSSQDKVSVAIIGAGPAGLTAAYLLSKKNVEVTVLEADPRYVGGISRTVEHKGFLFDIGGHRFFSKSQEVENLWTEILPDDMLVRPRSSRIYYRGKLFAYPLKATEALFKLGIVESSRCVLSYLKARLFPVRNPTNFEDWVGNQFGKRLFNIFFKTYTEKVWGMSCKEISADWAAQRIKGLNLSAAVANALLPKGKSRKVIKTLVESFRYPRKGPGMMWEVCAEKVRKQGGVIKMGERVTECAYDRDARLWRLTHADGKGNRGEVTAQHLISSAPIRHLVAAIKPELSEQTRRAARSLRYRDFLTVVLTTKDKELFNDNWIYIHDPNVKVGRIQNFKSWSPEMVPDPQFGCYGLEYFCFEGDQLWDASDEALITLGRHEMERLGLAKAGDFLDGNVVRQEKAYPVYDDEYVTHINTIRAEIEETLPTLHLVGRNGMHKYNNQDHSMMTAMLCVQNILAGRKLYDLWQVNQDAEYHETVQSREQFSTGGLRAVPTRASDGGRTDKDRA
jgi:protoporphyrinogen oxidase